MKRGRYLAVIGGHVMDRDALMAALRTAMPAAKVVHQAEGLLVVAENARLTRLGDGSIVIGSLFGRGGNEVPAGNGRPSLGSLIERCWGDYVAFAPPGGGAARLVRAPMGGLPCYWARHGGATLAASDVAALVAGGLIAPDVDVAALARHLAAPDLRTAETCLAGVGEIQGGEQASIAGPAMQRRSLWSPWAFAANPAHDPEEAASRVRNAALASVGALARHCRAVVLKLSGGLDSSIVGASLAASATPFTALNLVTRDAAGDERDYARLVAGHLGMPLVERFRNPAKVELGRSLASRLPRPTARNFLQESARIAREAAAEAGADALFDGGGGDNIFCSLQSARPPADCLIANAGARAFMKSVRDIAELAPASLAAVAWRALTIAARRSPAFRWPTDLRFLSAEAAREASRGDLLHPWLDPPEGALPGKSAHVAMVAAAQSIAEGFDAEDKLPTFSPLISQPMVEACIAVPSWLWFDDGRNRAPARHAFAGRLPTAVLARRSKGAPDGFIAELFEANRRLVREMLLGGRLTSAGLLDGAALDAAIGCEGPVQGHDYLRIMRLLDAEAWARSWP